MSDTLSVNRCSCGWQFYALNEWVKKCPQCRDEIKYCQKCGETIKRSMSDNYCRKCLTHKDIYCPVCNKEKDNYSKPFCNHCYNIDKKLKRRNMSKRIEKIKTFKQSQDKCPHNYDCANCPEEDCILPVDPDDKQEELF